MHFVQPLGKLVFSLSVSVLVCCLFNSLVHGQEKEAAAEAGQQNLVVKNSLDAKFKLELFSEAKQRWLKPSLELKQNETADLNVEFDGIYNFRLTVQDKEYLLGTFDLKKLVTDNKIDEIEIGLRSRSSAKAKRKSDREKKPEESVDNQPSAENQKDDTSDEDSKDPKDYEVGSVVKTGEGEMIVVETSREVSVTKTRIETRTRIVPVARANGEIQQVPQTYTVAVPYTETVTQNTKKFVPVGEHESGDATTGGLAGRPTLIFKADGKTIDVTDSLKKK